MRKTEAAEAKDESNADCVHDEMIVVSDVEEVVVVAAAVAAAEID